VARVPAKSGDAERSLALVESLQTRFVSRLEAVAGKHGVAQPFEAVEWLRDEGRHGGGVRYVHGDNAVFNRASVNVSQVHYDDDPNKRLASATALSTIIHPDNPNAPSIHMHISWTEMRDGTGYWRVMADLNPSIPETADRARFDQALRGATGDTFDRGVEQGERYFFIPALQRHRGVSHFYLEGYRTEDREADIELARRVGETMIDCYAELLDAAVSDHPVIEEADRDKQLAYHTVYLFQVLTLDRGTTSGLLVHDQNDVGILGSLPARIDRALLQSWVDKAPMPQDSLVRGIVDALPDQVPAPVTEDAKRALAGVVREHYRQHPEALKLQASGDVVPPTVANHQ
jgi:coproporphyrinogen III oxidase